MGFSFKHLPLMNYINRFPCILAKISLYHSVLIHLAYFLILLVNI